MSRGFDIVCGRQGTLYSTLIGPALVMCSAYIYGNEKEVGQGLQTGMKELGLKREDIFVTTKLWNTFHESAEVEPALDAQLEDLGLEYVDLYLMHWPVALRKGVMSKQLNPDDFLDVSVEETWKAMEKLVATG